MTSLSPFVYWAQNENKIFLKVDLKDVKNPSIRVEKRKLHFASLGIGAKGLHEYQFYLDFKDVIDSEKADYKITDSRVDIALTKKDVGWWPRLTAHPQKPSWLKIDFDKWQSEDDLDDEDVRDVREDYPDLYEKLKRDELGYQTDDFKKVYLTVYNLVMFAGFLYIIAVIFIRYLRDGIDSIPETYETIGPAFCFIQIIQFAEVMHAVFNIVKGNPLMSLMQTGGRALVLLALLDKEPRMQTMPIVFYLFLTWAAIEVIRYPYYMSQLYKIDNRLLAWLRYNAWILLYPVGFACEAVIIYQGVRYTDETNRWSISMPNALNFTFHFPTFLRAYLLLFMTPGIFVLMSHMYRMKQKRASKRKLK